MNTGRLSIVRQPLFWWVLLLLLVITGGLFAAGIVFTQGLWVTNLSNLVPWGLWITIDLSCVALSAGAFLLSAAVYLLRIKKLEPVARTAVFVGLIGYSMAVMTLLLDIGRPDRFWHGMVYWNIHSPLWEVTMCVALYFTVLSLEVIPIVGKSAPIQSRWPGIGNKLSGVHKIAPFLAVAGLTLSMLHQSSLGATYGVLKARPFWYKPSLAVLFMASAIVGGLALTVLISKVAGRTSKRINVNDDLLDLVSAFVGWALVVYLYLRFWDMLGVKYTYLPGRTEAFNMLTAGPLAMNFWGGEIIFGILIPMIILLSSRLRRDERLQIMALLLVVGGVIAFRWNTNMVGQLVVMADLTQGTSTSYTSYVPSLIEIAAGAGVIAYGALAVTMGIRFLGVVDHSEVEETVSHTEIAPVAAGAMPAGD
jgi:Ni/Fe-hydrogenase subunit HybB-like protein